MLNRDGAKLILFHGPPFKLGDGCLGGTCS